VLGELAQVAVTAGAVGGGLLLQVGGEAFTLLGLLGQLGGSLACRGLRVFRRSLCLLAHGLRHLAEALGLLLHLSCLFFQPCSLCPVLGLRGQLLQLLRLLLGAGGGLLDRLGLALLPRLLGNLPLLADRAEPVLNLL